MHARLVRMHSTLARAGTASEAVEHAPRASTSYCPVQSRARNAEGALSCTIGRDAGEVQAAAVHYRHMLLYSRLALFLALRYCLSSTTSIAQDSRRGRHRVHFPPRLARQPSLLRQAGRRWCRWRRNSGLGAGIASIPPLQPLVVPLPGPWHPLDDEDDRIFVARHWLRTVLGSRARQVAMARASGRPWASHCGRATLDIGLATCGAGSVTASTKCLACPMVDNGRSWSWPWSH